MPGESRRVALIGAWTSAAAVLAVGSVLPVWTVQVDRAHWGDGLRTVGGDYGHEMRQDYRPERRWDNLTKGTAAYEWVPKFRRGSLWELCGQINDLIPETVNPGPTSQSRS